MQKVETGCSELDILENIFKKLILNCWLLASQDMPRKEKIKRINNQNMELKW
jgi:hypothetical protein